MKGQITAVSVDEGDRAADLTVAVTTDAGVAVATRTVIISVDDFSVELVVDRVRGLLEEEIRKASDLPYTEAQIEDAILNLQVSVPG